MGSSTSNPSQQQTIEVEFAEFKRRVDRQAWAKCITNVKRSDLTPEEEACVKRVAVKYLQTFTLTKLMLQNEQKKGKR